MTEIEYFALDAIPDDESETLPDDRKVKHRLRRIRRVRKNDALMRITKLCGYAPCRGYIDHGFAGHTLLHSGKYIKHEKNSKHQRYLKRKTSREWRNCSDPPTKGNYYRRLQEYWWELY